MRPFEVWEIWFLIILFFGLWIGLGIGAKKEGKSWIESFGGAFLVSCFAIIIVIFIRQDILK